MFRNFRNFCRFQQAEVLQGLNGAKPKDGIHTHLDTTQPGGSVVPGDRGFLIGMKQINTKKKLGGTITRWKKTCFIFWLVITYMLITIQDVKTKKRSNVNPHGRCFLFFVDSVDAGINEWRI